jgi:hypothetical protein
MTEVCAESRRSIPAHKVLSRCPVLAHADDLTCSMPLSCIGQTADHSYFVEISRAEHFSMPNQLVSAQSKQPDRQKQIPPKIKLAVQLMIDGNGTGEPLNIGLAAAAVGMKRAFLRRWFTKAEVISYLYKQRRAFTASLCAANPAVLAGIRDSGGNDMARVKAITELESLDQPGARSSAAESSPWLTIRLVGAAPEPKVVEHVPPAIEPEPLPSDAHLDPTRDLPEPRFRWPKDE